LTSLLLLYFLNKQFSLKLPLRIGRRETKDIMRFSLPVYLSSLIGTFGSQIQTILLGTFSTVADIGINILARKVNLLGEVFHFSIVTASQPIVSDLHSRGEKEQLGRFYQTMNKWTFTLNFPMFLIVFLFPGPILSIFGKSFADGIGILTILAWRSLVDTGTGICGVMLGMTGNTHLTFVNTTTTFVLLAGLNFLLIPRWGLMGAATASLTASAVINLLRLIEVYVLLKLLPYNLSFLKPVAAGFVALLAALATMRVLSSEAGFIYTALNIAVLLAAYGGMIMLLGLSPEDRAVVSGLRRRLAAVLSRS
jgi:O-antigen/teichoic acid export membrane protein